MFGDRVSGRYSAFCMAVLLLLVTLLVPVKGGPDTFTMDHRLLSPPANGNWTVTGTELLSDLIVSINGNISIDGNLVLDNTTILMNQTGSYENTIYLSNGGSLILRNGSSLVGNGSAPFFLEALPGSYFEINRSKIIGCGVGETELEKQGMYIATTRFFMNESEMIDCYTGIISIGGNLSIRDSRLTRMISNGIQMEQGSLCSLRNVSLASIGSTALLITESSLDGEIVHFDSCFEAVHSVGSNLRLVDSGIAAMGPVATIIDSSMVEMIDCYPGIGGIDIMAVGRTVGPSLVEMLNTTFSMINVRDDSIVRESYRTDFQVRTNGHIPAPFSDVEISDVDGNVEWQALTDQDGWILDKPVVGAIHNDTGIHFMGPHTFSVLYEGAKRSKSFNVYDSHYQVIDVKITNPIVIIESIENNSWTSDREVSIMGRIETERPIVSLGWFLDGGREVMLDPSNEFSIDLNFGNDGEHDFRIRCMNDDGKYGEDAVHFGIDSVLPDLEITSPEEGAYVNSSNLKIEGECELGSELFINGNLVPHYDGTFSFEVFLFEGENQIDVEVIDRAENTVSVTRTVYLDSIPPSINIFMPVNGTRTKNDWIKVEGAVSHDTQVLEINGEEVEFSIQGFSYMVENLVEGNNKIVIKAIDRTGGTTVSGLWIFVDTQAPFLSVMKPPAYTNSKVIEIMGSTETGASVLVEGNPATLEGDGFLATVNLINGKNNISVSATDSAGNSLTFYYEVTLDTEKPTFERISPFDRTTFETIVVTIDGQVYDDSGIKSIKGYDSTGVPQLLSNEGVFEWVVSLQPGENTFTIEVEDLAGNLRATTLHYTYDPGSTADRIDPYVKITEPFANETLQEGEITIKGTASDDVALFRVRIRIDNGNWINTNGTMNWTFNVYLDIGIHIITVNAEDTSGNTATDLIKIRLVSRNQENGGDKDDNLSGLFITIAMIIIIIALVLVVFLLIRNRQLREEWADEQENEEVEPERELRRPARARPREAVRRYSRNDGRPPRNRRGPGHR